MNSLFISRAGVLFLTWLLAVAFFACSLLGYNGFQILNIVGFIFLAVVPGWLTVLSIRFKSLPFFGVLSLIVALSLLELMVMGLLGNYILPKFGIIHPLTQMVLIFEMGALLAILSGVAWVRLRDWKLDIGAKFKEIFPSKIDLLLSFLPIIFVLQSIVGALRLNNGASGAVTLFMLGEIAVFGLILYIYAKKVGENTIPTSLFFVSLSLLLMTSLRGWFITGHDVQIEYQVFELTKNANLWNIGFYHDAYNACLSITILPTIFFNLLKVSDPYIYKFFFQFFFAFCAGLVFLISRNWVDKRLSFLASFYFLAFPTFFTDMPFLVRQEIAFLFYGLMLWIIFEKSLDIKIRRIIFMILGVGVILSHYSTTYTTLFIFMLAVVSRPFFMMMFKYIQKKSVLLKDSALYTTNENQPAFSGAKIAFDMIVALFVLSFLWTSVITNTGGNLSKVLLSTISAIGSGFTENSRSTDATNLLSFRTPSQQQQFNTYIKKVIEPVRTKAVAGVYYDKSIYEKYTYKTLPDEKLPLTSLGMFVQKSGIDFVTLITLFGRLLAKLMEILAPLGILYLLIKSRVARTVDDEFFLLSIFSLIFIFLNIVIPVLSTEYGIFRALQQSMYVLALPMVLGSLWIGELFSKVAHTVISRLHLRFFTRCENQPIQEKEGSSFAVALALVFFLYSTSFIMQLFGGTPAMLYLNNSGRYYDNLLIKEPEFSAVDWLGGATQNDVNGVKIKIQTDLYSRKRLATMSSLEAYNEIYPGAVRIDSYVFLSQATVLKQRATLVYGGDQITYTYPVRFLDVNKDLIYNNGTAEVYR